LCDGRPLRLHQDAERFRPLSSCRLAHGASIMMT
jgi:hypothetical protein